VATFSDLTLDKSGAAYTMSASSSGLTSATFRSPSRYRLAGPSRGCGTAAARPTPCRLPRDHRTFPGPRAECILLPSPLGPFSSTRQAPTPSTVPFTPPPRILWPLGS
jgi:hypothetical protein